MTRPLYSHPNDWIAATLEPDSKGGVIVEAASGSTPPTEDESCWGGTFPWLTPKEVTDSNYGRTVAVTERSLTSKGLKKAGGLCESGGVLLTKRAPVGIPVMNSVPLAINQGFLSFRCGSRLDPLFLYYWFRLNGPYLEAVANGSTYPELYVSDLFEFEIALPSIEEQKQIVLVLGLLDDKIELNRRMNQTLEATANAVFKSWFTDPVQEGLPENWSEEPLPEVIDVNPTRSLRKGEVAPYLDMANMPTHSARALEVWDREFSSGMRFVNGDTLVARITPCLENGKTCFVDFLDNGKVGWGSTEYIVLRPKPPLPPEFAYFLARTEEFRSFAISNMTGTSGRQRVPADSFNHLKIAAPSTALAEKFGQFARTLLAKMKANDEESRTLAVLRDALLPKLLSGQLRVGK